MHPQEWWSPGVVLLKAFSALVYWWVLIASLCFIQESEAVVAYSTQHDEKKYTQVWPDKALDTFPDLWQAIFLWGFFSTLFIHVASSTFAFLMLRKHKYGRFSAACIIFIGTCTAFVMCAATSAAVGFVLYQAKFSLLPIHAMICGICQTGLFILFSFSRVMPTL